jgi:hypothetical protein
MEGTHSSIKEREKETAGDLQREQSLVTGFARNHERIGDAKKLRKENLLPVEQLHLGTCCTSQGLGTNHVLD